MLGALKRGSFQVHLLKTCNLKCRHCYSSSGPSESERLEVAVLSKLFCDMAQHGFNSVSLSGGEPLLHPDLPDIVASAKEAGLSVALTTNGTLFERSTWDRAKDQIDLVAVSVDGPPELHNQLRRSSTAYARMERGLKILKDSGLQFGLIHTLTKQSAPHLEWLGDFASQYGASLLQLHPLGLVGTGENLHAIHPDGELLAQIWIRARMLQVRLGRSVKIQVDLFNRELVSRQPEMIYAHCSSDVIEDGKLSELINPVVIMSNGDISPICHNMPHELRLGNIHDASLEELVDAWRIKKYQLFRTHCRNTWERIKPELEWPYFNWYEILERSPVNSSPPAVPHRLNFTRKAGDSSASIQGNLRQATKQSFS